MRMTAPGFAFVAVLAITVGFVAALFVYVSLVAAIAFAVITGLIALWLKTHRRPPV